MRKEEPDYLYIMKDEVEMSIHYNEDIKFYFVKSIQGYSDYETTETITMKELFGIMNAVFVGNLKELTNNIEQKDKEIEKLQLENNKLKKEYNDIKGAIKIINMLHKTDNKKGE